MANNFLPFCPTDTGTNLLTQAEYSVATDRTNGNQPGVASSKLNNKAIRQANVITSQLAQFLSNKSGASMLDDGSLSPILGVMTAMLTPLAPIVQTFTASGTYNQTYVFFISSGSATAAATYTNNGVTYTVVSTVAAGTTLVARGNNVPLASGTLTKASGTGDATLTFYAYRKPVAVNVTVVGAGGGGGGAAASAAGATAAATGGGGGGAALKLISSSVLGVTETVTVGAAGTAGAAGNNNGGAGGNSAFGAHCSATGGTAGGGSASTAGSGGQSGSVGGTGTGGDVNVTGNPSGSARIQAGGFNNWTSSGGTSIYPGAGRQSSGAAGEAGQSYGAGGGGGNSNASGGAVGGGLGAAGIVAVVELFQ